jgi:hypothetical protein
LIHVFKDILLFLLFHFLDKYESKYNLLKYFLLVFKDSLRTIYNSILSQHLAASQNAPFTQAVQRYTPQLVDGALAVHQRVAAAFLPTAIKFHYIFNLRDLSNIFQVKKLNIHLRLCIYLSIGYSIRYW